MQGLFLQPGSQLLSEWVASHVPEPATNAAKSTVDATAVYNQGVALMHEKKYAEALLDFETAVQAKPDFAEAHNNLAYCLRHQGPAKYS